LADEIHLLSFEDESTRTASFGPSPSRRWAWGARGATDPSLRGKKMENRSLLLEKEQSL
jgi:hypothetical protein